MFNNLSSLKSVQRYGVGGNLGGPIGPPVAGGLGAVVAVLDPEGEPVFLEDAVVGRFGLSRGGKRYELKNHLGNVLAVVTDLKLGQGQLNVAPAAVDYYLPQVVELSDYYPFGWQLPFRKWKSAAGYRFGFNGMADDEEVSGEGSSYDFGARMYDGRVGRWWSVDPLEIIYSDISTYSFASNSPLVFLDPNGQENIFYLVFLENQNTKTKISKTEKLKVEAAMNFILFENGINAKAKLLISDRKLDHSKLDKTDAVVYYLFESQISDLLPDLQEVYTKNVPGEWFDELKYGIVNLKMFGTGGPPGAAFDEIVGRTPIVEEWKLDNKKLIKQLQTKYGMAY